MSNPRTKLAFKEVPQEEIDRLRKERRERHLQEQREQEKQLREHPNFFKRPILPLPDEYITIQGTSIKIMTYNTLAQTLIRRNTFPDSRGALKWHYRSQTLLQEITFYHPDILCLQEVDKIQWEKFWSKEIQQFGYMGQFFTCLNKVHGVAIIWDDNKFSMLDNLPIVLDDITIDDDLGPTTGTMSVALMVALKFKDPKLNQNGIIISTTHLFWHLFGTFERTRQCYIILDSINQFREKILDGNPNGRWFTFLTGDFNSSPDDPPYLSITQKPVKFQGKPRAVIECSTAYHYSEKRNSYLNDNFALASGEYYMHRKHTHDEGNIKDSLPFLGKKDSTMDECAIEDDESDAVQQQPKNPRPTVFNATVEQTQLVNKLENLHNQVDLIGTSLYGLGYNIVHPENVNHDTIFQEPEMSHKSISWAGLLDYMFFIKPFHKNVRHKSSCSSSADSCDKTADNEINLRSLQNEDHLAIKSYLKMPLISEMPHHSEPYVGEYPSDHLAMMCEVILELKEINV